MIKISEGDTVTIWIDSKRVYLIKVKKGGQFSTDKGNIKFDEILGKEYGSFITLSSGSKAYLLIPSLTDMYFGLRRPTQVMYPKDLGYVIFSSGIKPGDVVVEAGTGSGFLTATLAHFVGDSGKVYTYEVKEEFQKIAIENISKMKLTERIVFKLKDIRTGIDEKDVDAIFLDLADPWNVANIAYDSLKPSGIITIFVPTVNQIEKTYFALKNSGFVDIHVEELILREYQVKEGAVRPKNIGIVHTGYIIRGRKYIKA